MAERLSLRVPRICPHCGASERVKLEQTIKGSTVILSWCCTACDHGWPITITDAERRREERDRRKAPRKDRRTK
jgi:hypothetical protein